MENLRQVISVEVNQLLNEIKSKSETYGDALKIISDMSWSKPDNITSLVISNVNQLLLDEMKAMPINKRE